MSAKMFWAHALKGFTDTFTAGIERRQDRMEDLLDNGFDAAKRIAPSYMKTQGQFKQIKEIQTAMQRDFDLTDDEFVALVDATDVTSLYKDVYDTKQYRDANQLGSLDKSEILSLVDMPDDFKLPEGMTADAAIRQVLGLQTASLQKETDPKSEGAKQRSFAQAAKDLFMLDPRMSAEQQLKNMKYMGVNVNDLIAYQSLGGGRQDIFSDVSRTSEYSLSKDDYTAADITRTQNYAAKLMSLGITNFDLNDSVQFADYTEDNTNAGEIKKAVNDTASSMSSLERQIIMAGRGNELFAGRVGRFQIIDQLSRSVNSQDEATSLNSSIKSNFAIDVIKGAIAESRELTDAEIDIIIAGERPEEKPISADKKPTDDLQSTVVPKVETPVEDAVPEVLKSNVEVQTAIQELPKDKRQDVLKEINNASPDTQLKVADLLIEQAQAPTLEAAPALDIKSAVEQINEVQEGTESVEEKADKVIDILLEKANIIAPTNEEELGYFKDDLDEAMGEDFGLTLEPAVKDEVIRRAESFSITSPDFDAGVEITTEPAGEFEFNGVTYDEWQDMSRKERKDKGLPQGELGAQFKFKRFQKGLQGSPFDRSPTIPEDKVVSAPEIDNAPVLPQPDVSEDDINKAVLALRLFNDLNENIPDISTEFVDAEVIKDFLKQEGIEEDPQLIQMILKQIPAE
jgi:hypothetical protein